MTQTQVLTDGERGKAALKAIDKIQKAMAGEAERSGLDSDEKIIAYCKEIRRELRAEHPELYGEPYARHD